MSERRSQFVSAVTHELKTPLTNIRMYVEMLEEGIAGTPEREREYLAVLNSESSRLSGLINNVLELAKLERKKRQFFMKLGDFSDVLHEIEAITAQQLRRDGFKLVTQLEPLPVFSYDREVMVQILLNLIENSVKFGQHSATKEITIKVGKTSEYIHIALSDKGPGIPNTSIKHIFDDFYRAENDLTRTTGGTGIGLALVKKFVTAMGGKVQAHNNAVGCTITLLLPIS